MAEIIAEEIGMDYLEVLTRDDEWVNQWYVKNGFEKVYSYLHVYLEGNKEVKEEIRTKEMPGFQVIQAFAHYSGPQQEYVKSKFNRVHECNCYMKNLK